jgi:hypothetical protein
MSKGLTTQSLNQLQTNNSVGQSTGPECHKFRQQGPSPRTHHVAFKTMYRYCENQRSGSTTFWNCMYPDPNQWFMDPDATLFIRGFQDSKKISFFCLLLTVGTIMSVFGDYKRWKISQKGNLKKSQNCRFQIFLKLFAVESGVLFIFLLVDGTNNPDPGGLKTYRSCDPDLRQWWKSLWKYGFKGAQAWDIRSLGFS